MKRVKILLGVLSALVLALLAGMGLFKHFVTDQIMDGGDMTNPFPSGTTVETSEAPKTAELFADCESDPKIDFCTELNYIKHNN